MLWEQSAEDQVGIGDGKGPTFAVACWSRMRGGRLLSAPFLNHTHLWSNDEHAVSIK